MIKGTTPYLVVIAHYGLAYLFRVASHILLLSSIYVISVRFKGIE